MEAEQPRQRPAKWTYINFRPRAPQGFGADSVVLTSGYGEGHSTSVHRDDLPRLDKGNWLVTSLVDLYCQEVGNVFVERSPDRYNDLCVLPSTCWFACSESNGKFSNLSRIDPASCPLDHKFVAFPMNSTNTHWALGILLYASDLLVDLNPSGPIRTCLIVLNSIHGYDPPNLSRRYPDFVRLMAMGKKVHSAAISRLKLFKPKVLQQPNGTDCGLYPGHFLSVFLTNPSRYESICKGECDLDESPSDVWQGSRVVQARDSLRDLVKRASIVRHASHVFHSGRTPADLGLEY